MRTTEVFKVGDIVRTVRDHPQDIEEGVVVEVEAGGYVTVRVNSGSDFAYWPQEIVNTGRKVTTAVLDDLKELDDAIANAQGIVRMLTKLRQTVIRERML